MKNSFKIIKTEPKTLHYTNVKKYDVALFEYGDYDNWVCAIILDIELVKMYNTEHLKIHFCYKSGQEDVCYASSNDFMLEIIGHAVENENSKEL